ncbi:hypothetical protein BJ138DRAFT_1131447 [Hygrophoropsis aurantiaca]|uniref:Uncharacterized protein n=1 Tax=Hygrophoropsis aurantiaca TaxID=72124 RepID=A0ACB7ZRA8_9AGAM|nr:hypothetical protein BJ138DRAFT_1131447 [Hygrophoropsis aurantiaca]
MGHHSRSFLSHLIVFQRRTVYESHRPEGSISGQRLAQHPISSFRSTMRLVIFCGVTDPRDAAEWREEQTRRQPTRAKICDAAKPFCGFHGPEVEYEHPPRNSFQRQCRRKESPDMQHYTRTYHSEKSSGEGMLRAVFTQNKRSEADESAGISAF